VSAEDRQEEDKEGPTLAISEVTKKGLCATRLHNQAAVMYNKYKESRQCNKYTNKYSSNINTFKSPLHV